MEARIERAMSANGLQQCSQCGEWVKEERLSDHRIWAHNVGGATGIKYFAPDTEERRRHYLNQMEGTSV